MKTKIFYLLLLCLMVLGRGEVWAEDIVCSAYLSGVEKKANCTNCQLIYNGNADNIYAGTLVEGTIYYHKKMDSNSDYYEIIGYKFQAGDKIVVYLYNNGGRDNKCRLKSTSLSTSASEGNVGATEEYTLTSGDIEDGGALRIFRESSHTYFVGVQVTCSRTVTNYTTPQSGPHTWDFTSSGTDWATSITQLGSDPQWYHVTYAFEGENVVPKDEYRVTVSESNWGHNVNIVKGLIFNSVSSWGPCIDNLNKCLYVPGDRTITIPSLSTGQRIRVTTTNNQLSGITNTTYDSAEDYYVVSADGNAVISFSGQTWITKIEVLAPDDGTVTYPHVWDFSDVSSAITQIGAGDYYWNSGYGNESIFSNAFFTLRDGTYIQLAKGLKLSAEGKDRVVFKNTAGDNSLRIGAATIIIPNVPAGMVVTLTEKSGDIRSGNTITVTDAGSNSVTWHYESDVETKAFEVTTTGDVTITSNLNYDNFIKSIAVLNPMTLEEDTPKDGATGVAIGQVIKLKANYSVQSITATLTDTDNNSIALTPSINNNKISFSHDNLKSWTTYTLSVAKGGEVGSYYGAINISPFSLSFTTTGLSLDKTIPANGSEITGNVNLSSNIIQIVYKSDISLVDGMSYSNISIYDGTTSVNFVAGNCNISGKNALLDCPVTLVSGKTYTVTVPAGTFKDGSGLTNAENVFSFNVDATEPEILLVIPTGWTSTTNPTNVSVATRLVVSSNDNTNKELNTATSFTATLTGDGTTRSVTAVADGTYQGWAFKPETALNPNTTYTLTIPANSMVTKNGTRIASDKSFTFTTVAAITGTAPLLLKTNGNSSPYENEVIADFQTNGVGNTVTLKFDQNITLEDGAVIEVIPYGGSEYNSRGEYYSEGSETYANQITVSGNQLSFAFSTNDMHYDLYYRIVLRANTVLGQGGIPNAADEYIFKVGPAPGYTGTYNFQNKEGYPYTWDFTTISSSSSAITANGAKWKRATDSKTNTSYYYRNTMEDCFCMELNGNNTSNDVLNDFRGLRFGTKRKSYSSNASNGGPIRIFEPSTDGSGNMRIHGNTHYMTIPNVPASADDANGDHYIYIRASVSNGNAVLALNAPSSVAEWVGTVPQAGQGVQVYKVRVKTAGDIPFVCSDVNIYQIAVSTYNKTLTSGGDGYATDAHDYSTTEVSDKGVDYAMTATLADQTVTPYYVTNVSGGYDKNTPGTITLTQVSDGVAPGQGTVLIGTPGTTFPIFAKAYSKANSETSANLLSSVVTSGSVTLNQQSESGGNYYYYYVLNNQPIKVADDEGETQIGSSSGMGFYLVHKSTSIPMQAHSAYLIIDRKLNQGGGVATSSGAREVYFFKFEDENGNDLTGISTMEADGIKDNSTNGDGLYYDLHGQRHVYPTKPGLYIHNGKKVYLK